MKAFMGRFTWESDDDEDEDETAVRSGEGPPPSDRVVGTEDRDATSDSICPRSKRDSGIPWPPWPSRGDAGGGRTP